MKLLLRGPDIIGKPPTTQTLTYARMKDTKNPI